MYYVYQYIDPETNTPFYIGKGKDNRMLSHLKETIETTDNKKKFYKIQSLRNKGLEPIVNIIVDNINDESEAYCIEDTYILKYGREGFEENGILTNICINAHPPTLKGELNGMFNKQHTDNTKQAVSRANKGKTAWNKGIAQTQDVKDAVSRANKGKTAWNKDATRSTDEKEAMKAGWAKKIEEGFVPHNKGKSIPKDYTCKHCKKQLTKQNYTRWHGAKCKEA
tara:strand:- start:591 stop:1262 length:672 start_codon:yes stop_codon:yes gene_type:complete